MTQINLKEVEYFAYIKHLNQFRDGGSPYIQHPLCVAKIVDRVKGQFSRKRDIILAGAVLHDTLEDTYTSIKELKERFGEEVASLVEEVTTASFVPKLVGKAQYLAEKMINMTKYALVIKLADRLDNIMDMDKCSENKRRRTIADTKYIINKIENNYKGLTQAHLILIRDIKLVLSTLEI